MTVDPGDEGSLTDKMASLLTNSRLAETSRQHGIKQAARFNWADSGKKLAEVIQDVQKANK